MAMDVNEVIGRYEDAGEVRLALRFEGTVQGVGFRWTTQELARQRGVAGWVRNESDGTVTAELQGSGTDVCAVLAGLRDQFADARRQFAFLRRLSFTVASCEERVPRELPQGARFEVRA